MKKSQERVLHAVFGYILMIMGVVTIVYSLILLFVFNRAFRSDELTVILLVALVLIYLGYYISRGKEIPLPQIASK